jgi:adenylosuccinate synthase
MAKRVILLSGPVASGKTTLGDTLVRTYGFHLVKTRELIRIQLGTEPERGGLQRAGEALDRQTDGRWVAEALAREVQQLREDAQVLIDAVRLEAQVTALRQAFGPKVVHVHITAPIEVLNVAAHLQ